MLSYSFLSTLYLLGSMTKIVYAQAVAKHEAIIAVDILIRPFRFTAIISGELSPTSLYEIRYIWCKLIVSLGAVLMQRSRALFYYCDMTLSQEV